MRFETNIRTEHRFVAVCVVLLCFYGAFSCGPASAQTNMPPAASSQTEISALNDDLGRLSGRLQKGASPQSMTGLSQSLPPQWNVTTSEKTFAISTKYLREQLAAGSRENAKAWIDNLATQLSTYSQKQSKKQTNAQAELDRILGGAEFGAARPPSEWDLLRQRLAQRLQRFLERLFGGLARYPLGSKILFWIVVVAAVGFIALWVFRFLTSRDRLNSLPSAHVPRPVRTWQEWIRAAKESAARGDFREAIHSAYWAGITRLQDIDAVPKDAAKTPREYLRLLSETPSSMLTPPRDYRQPLSALTARMEKSWYANRGASSDDFRDALHQLEAFGCQLE
jgi:hypothetical protein